MSYLNVCPLQNEKKNNKKKTNFGVAICFRFPHNLTGLHCHETLTRNQRFNPPLPVINYHSKADAFVVFYYVEGEYWFEPVRGSVCPSVHHLRLHTVKKG